MKRPRLMWLVLALASLALIAAACSGAGASGDGSEGGEPGASQPSQPSQPTEPAQPALPPADPDEPVSSDDPVRPTPPPSSDEPAFATEPQLAPIDELDLLIRESYPPQYAVRIVSGIPSGCARYDRTEVERDGNRITIEVWNRVISDPDVACTMIYGMHEQTVELGTDFEPGEEYTVIVNGERLSFTAQ
jgi:hypothetical protein